MTNGGSPRNRSATRVLVRVLVVVGKVVVAVLALLGAYLVLATFVLHGRVNERSLFQSVSGVAGSAFDDNRPCEDVENELVWRCTVSDREGSGSARYRVSVSPDGSCWSAVLELDGSEGGMPETLSGCVRRLEWSIW
jgi:hypothetical protein